MKIVFSIILIFFTFKSNISLSDNYFIKYKVNNEIITNFDIEKEKNYLVSLNSSLNDIDEDRIKSLATKSIIREKKDYDYQNFIL